MPVVRRLGLIMVVIFKSKGIILQWQPAPQLKPNICRDLLQCCTYFVWHEYLVFWSLSHIYYALF